MSAKNGCASISSRVGLFKEERQEARRVRYTATVQQPRTEQNACTANGCKRRRVASCRFVTEKTCVPIAGLALEHGFDQTLGWRRDFNVARKAVFVVQNALVRGLHVLGFVRRFANEHRVQNHAHRPDVHFERVSALGLVTLNDFRCNVVGRAANGFPLLVLVFDARRETQIPDFHAHVLVQKEVPQL